MRMTKFLRVSLAFVLAAGGLFAVASPAHAACGDTVAQWVDPTLGSAWSGTVGGTSFTAVHTNAANASATVVSGLSGTGLGTWTKPAGLLWTATVAGVWFYRFEVGAISCSGGKVTEAGGGATDYFGNVSSVSMTRTL